MESVPLILVESVKFIPAKKVSKKLSKFLETNQLVDSSNLLLAGKQRQYAVPEDVLEKISTIQRALDAYDGLETTSLPVYSSTDKSDKKRKSTDSTYSEAVDKKHKKKKIKTEE